MDNQLPERFAVIGLDKKAMTLDEFIERFKDGANQFCRCGGVKKEDWDKLAPNLSFISGDFADPATYTTLSSQLKAQETKWGNLANHIF
jgi:glucose-6-phosphate 1-dehydrogenase